MTQSIKYLCLILFGLYFCSCQRNPMMQRGMMGMPGAGGFVQPGLGGQSPLATPQNPPNGVPGQPVNLGQYKTCMGVGVGNAMQPGVGGQFQQQPGFGAQQPGFQQNLQQGMQVQCNNSHTCFCLNNQYFIDNNAIGGRGPTYRCIEPPTARAETPMVYNPNQGATLAGVIKFAAPRSFCAGQNNMGQNNFGVNNPGVNRGFINNNNQLPPPRRF